MAANPGRPESIGVDELEALETSVLKTLCLTINTAGSELKYKILDSLSEDDFYFPVLRAVFQTLSEMHLRGDYVISANLEEELLKQRTEVAAGFGIEQLFDGALPSLTDLNGWVARLKERSRSGLVPTVKPPAVESVLPPARQDATVVKPVAEVKRLIQEELRKSSPSVAPGPAATAPSRTPEPKSSPRAPVERLSPPPVERLHKPKPPPTPPPREKSSPAVAPSAPKSKPKVLSSEGDDWASYMEDLAAKQGKRFDTGFARLDGELGGLAPGLMLLVDEDRRRVVSFLKQIVDQMASKAEVRCLFFAAEEPKSSLRLRTLARLSGVPVQDLEKGRLKKDSPEWQRVDAAGRRAAAWLKRVFVYEPEGEIELTLVRELARKLIDASEQGSCVVVIDALEKVAVRGAASGAVSALKSLASSLDVLILAATTDPTLLASRDADYASVFRQTGQGLIELEVLRAGKDSSTVVRFRYQAEVCRFSEP